MLRLAWFDLAYGARIAFQVLNQRFGVLKTFKIIGLLQLKQILHDPFHEINLHSKPDLKGKLSQRQMGPLVLLDQVLNAEGYSKQENLSVLRKLSSEMAIAFLKYNVPIIEKKNWQEKDKSEKIMFLNKIIARFFNAKGEAELDEKDNFKFNVSACYFASYAKQLNVLHLAPLFCQADKLFFDHYQKDISFKRSQTLAEDNLPCDFQFYWK